MTVSDLDELHIAVIGDCADLGCTLYIILGAGRLDGDFCRVEQKHFHLDHKISIIVHHNRVKCFLRMCTSNGRLFCISALGSKDLL